MGKREKKSKSPKSDALEEEEESNSQQQSLMHSDDEQDDDDAEANEDLSLKMVEKAMLRECNNRDEEEAEILANFNVESGKNKQEKRMKAGKKTVTEADPVSSGIDKGFESFCSDMFPVERLKEEENVDTAKATEVVDDAVEKNPNESSNNAVLRRLLRGPRYFDPPDSSWGTCYNCGEEGHSAVNCTSAKRKKPCFVCGSLEHNAKHCAKGHDCFICKKGGHRAKDCSERNQGGSQNCKLCLKCGDSGHDMFSCRNNYSADDLQEIRCYICKSFSHLCCGNYPDNGPREVSCYRCGLLGHTGLACMGSRGEISGTGSLNLCYRCGEEGHFARACNNIKKVKEWNRDISTPKKVPKRRKDFEFRSVPHDLGKMHKKNRKNEGGYTTAYSKKKRRGGWIMDDPGDFPEHSRWRSPSTPRNKRAKISNFSTGGHASASRSSRKSNKLDFDNSASYGSAKYHHHRFSASRFGNSSHDRWRRNYDW